MGHSVAGWANGFQERPSTAVTLFLKLRGLRFELFIHPYGLVWKYGTPVSIGKSSCSSRKNQLQWVCRVYRSFKQSHDMRRIKHLSVLTSSPRLLSSLRPSLQWKPYTRCCPRRTRPTMRWPSRMCGRQRWPFCCRWGDGSRRISEMLPLGSDAWKAWMLDAEMKIDSPVKSDASGN